MSSPEHPESQAEELFIQLFSETFGAEKARFLCQRYHFYDIFANSQYADFVFQHDAKRTAIELEDSTREDPFFNRHLKENSMVKLGWEVYRWALEQIQRDPDTVREELRLLLGDQPRFQEIEDPLPLQHVSSLDGSRLELKEHQETALEALAEMRRKHETIALLHHATGTGKTVTAVLDARRCGGRTLFLVHTRELVEQAADTFRTLWPDISVGCFSDSSREIDTHVVCGTVQSVSGHLDLFSSEAFSYIIFDEAHHATSDTYQRILAHFKPAFLLGLTATPERTDGRNILEVFQHTAHRLDLRTAVELGELVPVRCIRIRTNIDFSHVRYNGNEYSSRDLEKRIFVPERNRLIVQTWLTYVKGLRTVVFCVSVRHAQEIARMFREEHIPAEAVSGKMKTAERQTFQTRFRNREIQVLCVCDLLNEGWDCPEAEVLFMARPTMSKLLYTQQLGRGMRKAPDKESLIVFDFVDNASRFTMSCSLHRLFGLKEYRPGQYVAAPAALMQEDAVRYERGEKPQVLLDWPIQVTDYESVDLFDWQSEAEGMLSVMDFVRRVSASYETVNSYINSGKLKADLEVPAGNRPFRFFKEETLQDAARKFGWKLIDESNRRELFIDTVEQMDMVHSYKPLLLMAILTFADDRGTVPLSSIAGYFRSYFEGRRASGLIVEKPDSVFARSNYTDKEAERTILRSPFKRFEDRQMLRHTQILGTIQVDEAIWKALTPEDKQHIRSVCEQKLKEYYDRLGSI